MANEATAKSNGHAKSGHVPIRRRRVEHVKMSPENERLYRPILRDDPDIQALAESIREYGIQQPLLLTSDGYLYDGHRRYVAAQVAGLRTVPVRVNRRVSRAKHHNKFLSLLRECNRQRVKTRTEALREEAVSADPDQAYASLLSYRQATAIRLPGPGIEIRGKKTRAAISDAKRPFVDAVQQILDDRWDFWPLSDRSIHYALLNDPPRIHASKPGSVYANEERCYKAACDLLTRARLEGEIPWEAIADPTRPCITWNLHRDVATYLRAQLSAMFQDYWRDLQQSQPNLTVVIGEKNTVESVIRPVCAQYCVGYIIGRGYCSLQPRYELAQQFEQSGKDRLVLLILSDFDPDGEEIAHSFVRSMRDDFGIVNVDALKVALTADQVAEHNLPPRMKAKKGSSTYKRFVEKHGHDVFELEALPPDTLQELLRDAIDSVMDVAALNYEIGEEKKDAAFLAEARQTAVNALAGTGGFGDAN